MRFFYWAAVGAMALMPLNYVLMVAGKIAHGETFGEEDVIGFGCALFGVVAATVIYRALLYRSRSERNKAGHAKTD